jgi:uncharacterized protein
MNVKREGKLLVLMGGVFLVLFTLPVGWARFDGAVFEALALAKWYAREHVLLCLVPALFIAGAIGVFISQASVMKYLGAKANKVVAYGVASVSGSILAVCSCTVLPLFAGIWRMGAGLGPATAFLYSGPAINVLAIILTARILGLEIGIARAVGAIVFSIVIGLTMHLIFRKEEAEKAAVQATMPEPEAPRPLWQTAMFMATMVGVLVFANWGAPSSYRFTLRDGSELSAAVIEAPHDDAGDAAVYTLKVIDGVRAGDKITVPATDVVTKIATGGLWTTLWQNKWLTTGVFAAALGVVLVLWFQVVWWKVLAAAVAPLVLALSMPTGGMWVLVPFTAAVAGLSVVLVTSKGEGTQWLEASWSLAKQILPLLLMGVLVAGFCFGGPGGEGIIPKHTVAMLVGDTPDVLLEATGWSGAMESLVRTVWPVWANFFASIFGALMYFATLTEVPILQGLLGAGMGKGPALALLLAGPALSLPNMLVIRSVLGTRKTLVFVTLVVVMATLSGLVYGALF